MIDLHAHILPAIDDGPATMDEAVALCRALVEDGVTTAVATPHMFDGVHEAERDAILRRVAELRAALDEEDVPLTVLPGADIRADARVLEAARSGSLLSINEAGRYALIEPPPDVIPPRFDWFLFDLATTGCTPILTHPERHVEFQRRPETLEDLVSAGVKVQVSAPSLTGHSGRRARKAARQMLRRGMVHFLASDCHHVKWRPPRLRAAVAEAAAQVGREAAEALVDGNPAAVLAGGLLACRNAGDGQPAKVSDVLIPSTYGAAGFAGKR